MKSLTAFLPLGVGRVARPAPFAGRKPSDAQACRLLTQVKLLSLPFFISEVVISTRHVGAAA
jgi:hypothetical protein